MCFWAAPRSLVATQGISVDFFSSGYLDISVPRVRLVHLCIQCTIPLARWVSPFGHCRIKACCQLPDTFRRLPRPSSPLTAKASTVCAYSLDHITPSRLGVKFCRRLQATDANIATTQIRNLSIPALASTTRLDSSSQTLATSHFQRSRAGLSANAISSLSVRDSSSCSDGGSGRTRTTDLTLIRGALDPPAPQTRTTTYC